VSAHDPFRPKEQRAYVHGFDVEITAHPCGGWTFEVWDVAHAEMHGKGAADTESTVKMLALRTAGECAERRDGVSNGIRDARGFLADLDRRLQAWVDGVEIKDPSAKELADDE
jgi:hypothetical protein